jgi:peptide/nickel transport system ATP-binding protein
MKAVNDILLEVDNLSVNYGRVQAVAGVNFEIRRGETLGLVGESGCGKSSAARAIMQLPRPSGGHVRFGGVDLAALRKKELRRLRPKFQMIFQDPVSSLNPRRTVFEIVAAPLEVAGRSDKAEIRRVVYEMLEAVGLDPDQAMARRPHEFSGGQCQRISIARALVLEPELLVCDEPVSALDVLVQAQILNLLQDMKQRYRLTMLFISHDLAVIKNVSDWVAVMYLGKLVETAPAEELYRNPAHPYTRVLLDAVPVPDPQANVGVVNMLAGELPSPLDPPSGCRFRTRCPLAQPRCGEEEPTLVDTGPGHRTACHFPLR